jgi:hypothetical protein
MNDSQLKRYGYGIGEAGQVPASTSADELEAERLQPTVTRKTVLVKCPICRQMYNKNLGMGTSLRGMVCPDCYDTCEEEA